MNQFVNEVLKRAKNKLPEFRTGDSIGVFMKVKEGGKQRIQQFKGVVIKLQKRGFARSFTLRKVSNGVGVEKNIPFNSPKIDKIVVYSKGKVRRSKIYYLRKLEGKASRIKSSLYQEEQNKEVPDTSEENTKSTENKKD